MKKIGNCKGCGKKKLYVNDKDLCKRCISNGVDAKTV